MDIFGNNFSLLGKQNYYGLITIGAGRIVVGEGKAICELLLLFIGTIRKTFNIERMHGNCRFIVFRYSVLNCKKFLEK
jgi:hypothetical protein